MFEDQLCVLLISKKVQKREKKQCMAFTPFIPLDSNQYTTLKMPQDNNYKHKGDNW